MKVTYDRLAVGERLRLKRTLLGFTQDEVAEKIDRAAKYYADIERGSCGMSVETLMAICNTLSLTLDYAIYGTVHSKQEETCHTNEVSAILELLDNSSEHKRKYALRMLRLFLIACDGLSDEGNNEE